MLPRNLLFWKWSDDDLDEGAVLDQVEDLCRRSSFEVVAVGLEHTNSSFDSDRAHAALAATAERLAQHGRRLVLSIDPRQEPDWATAYPDHCLAWVDTADVDLGDAEARAWTSHMLLVNDHFGVHAPVRSELLAAFAYDPADPGATPTRLDDAVEVVGAATPGHVEVRLPERRGARGLVMVAHWLDYPDVFAEAVFQRHRELLDRYVDLPLAGAAIDEWGTVPQPAFTFGRAWSTPWWSAGLAASYEAATGRTLLDDLFRQQVAEPGSAAQTAAIVDYYRVLHDRCADFERLHYDATKERFGPDAYVGFHNTWWAVEERHQSAEIWKNGYSWWAAKRDLGQTDEVAPMGVRMALARKAGHPSFFNMWYSMGAHDLATYAQDAWRNARYGGRTNHLGYRCEAERWAVMELADGGLEEVSAMEEVIGRMAPHVTALVDTPVLVVFGWEAAVDWRRHVGEDGRWDFPNDTLSRGYDVLRAVWDAGYLAEYVPDHEDLTVEDGRVTWCGHRFDAALYVDADAPAGANAATVADGAEAVAFLEAVGARRNDVQWGCRLEDGTVLVAAPGEGLDPIIQVHRQDAVRKSDTTQSTTALQPTGNRIEVEVDLAGRRVAVDADDFVVIAADASSIVAGELRRVAIDGEDVTDRYR